MAKTTNVVRRPTRIDQPPRPNKVLHGDNLQLLQGIPGGSVDLIYIDPPFNTGRRQQRLRMRTVRDPAGDRVGFGGRRYRTELITNLSPSASPNPQSPNPQSLDQQSPEPRSPAEVSADPATPVPPVTPTGYVDTFDDLAEYLRPRMLEAHRVLAPTGSLFFHIDYREVHYCKVMLDQIFGRTCFQNEIIWAYDYGARATKRWPAKHDNILWYTKDPALYTFHLDATDRIPYMAPGLVGPEKAARGKTPTDVWWHTIVSPTGREKTGYATQKPLGILERIIKVHTNPGDLVLDFFAGSGTTGEAAARHGRSFILIDSNEEAIRVMQSRLAPWIAAPRSEEPG